ncbi:hypothetical protein WN943_013058 [Citrus x changshan-huyou]
MAQCYRDGNEYESQAFSSYTESQYTTAGIAGSQSYYTKPAVAGSQNQTQYCGHTTNPALGYSYNTGKPPLTGYQQASHSNYGVGTGANLTGTYGPAPAVTGYYGKHHGSHGKTTHRRKLKCRDSFGTVEYSSCSESESDDECRGPRCL